jgi:hypothetical protein
MNEADFRKIKDIVPDDELVRAAKLRMGESIMKKRITKRPFIIALSAALVVVVSVTSVFAAYGDEILKTVRRVFFGTSEAVQLEEVFVFDSFIMTSPAYQDEEGVWVAPEYEPEEEPIVIPTTVDFRGRILYIPEDDGFVFTDVASFASFEEARDASPYAFAIPRFIPENAELVNIGIPLWVNDRNEKAYTGTVIIDYTLLDGLYPKQQHWLQIQQYHVVPGTGIDVQTVFPFEMVTVGDIEALAVTTERVAEFIDDKSEEPQVMVIYGKSLYWVYEDISFLISDGGGLFDWETLIAIAEGLME